MGYLAFLDESGTPGSWGEVYNRFYLITAFIIPVSQMNQLYLLHKEVVRLLGEGYGVDLRGEVKGKKLFDELLGKFSGSDSKYFLATKEFVDILTGIFVDFVGLLDYDLIIFGIDKFELNGYLLSYLDDLLAFGRVKPPNYFNVMKFDRYRDRLRDIVRTKLEDVVRSYLYTTQLVNEVVLRIEKLMEEKVDSVGLETGVSLLFDADARNLTGSIYALISEDIFSRQNVPFLDGEQSVKYLETYFLVESHLNPGIQIADLISYTVYRFLSYADTRDLLKAFVKNVLLEDKPIVDVWGRRIKIIPWSQSRFSSLF